MSIADTQTTSPVEGSFADRRPTAKILHLKQALQEKPGAAGEWAKMRASDARDTVERRPFTTAGISAGAAFMGGLALGLLLWGRMSAMSRTPLPVGLASRLGSELKSRFKM